MIIAVHLTCETDWKLTPRVLGSARTTHERLLEPALAHVGHSVEEA